MSGFSCGWGGSSMLLFACSGSSTVGQLTNQVAMQLARDGVAVMSYRRGGAPERPRGDGEGVRAAGVPPLFDGYDHRCALKAFKHVGVSPHVCPDFTEKGFVKQHGVALTGAELERSCSLARKPLEGAACSTAS